ncbi:2'-5' RNA ligase family protein [Nannocystis sp.]|uniref:2'-5' RNA ligase family protein n=1 Tax=Nannocystis sp. TaxID=1962667 RepID=UPI0024290170|nr:2'-5' RNA ligase family protein [Nannocystis sp.]MBK7825966.1 2'-5' RNA ligase family protein [Nannocystis sp.]MBK9755499.1 2'-5' RNA ligase family protein [Nannocystis sp.]
MQLLNPTYICLDVPEPQASQVLELRRRHCERLHSFPVELTIAGSSGVGAIRAQLDPEDVAARLSQFCARTPPICAEFGAVVRFPGTDIFVLSLADPIPFEAIHDGLKQTGLRFEASRFPFFPHCTLRMAGPLSAAAVSELFALRLPGRFMLGSLALYQRTPDDAIEKVWSAPLAGAAS